MSLIALILTTILILVLFIVVDKEKWSQIKLSFQFTLLCLLTCCIGLILQIVFGRFTDIPPIYFDYFVYIGTVFLPVAFLLTSLTFTRTKLKFNWKYNLLFVIPIISLLVLWTNDFHHLFYKTYSTNLNECVTGPYATIHTLYS